MKNLAQVKVGSCILKAGLALIYQGASESAGADKMSIQEIKKRDILISNSGRR